MQIMCIIRSTNDILHPHYPKIRMEKEKQLDLNTKFSPKKYKEKESCLFDNKILKIRIQSIKWEMDK